MQVNNNLSTQNFGAIKIPSKTPKAIKTFISENITSHINPLLINKMDSLGYDIKINPRYYKTANDVKFEEFYMHVADRYDNGKEIAYPNVASGGLSLEQIAKNVKKWNSIMCNYFGIPKA